MNVRKKRKQTDGCARRLTVRIGPAVAAMLVFCLLLPISAAAVTAGNWPDIGSPTSPEYASIYCMALDQANDTLYVGGDDGQVYCYKSGAWSSTERPADENDRIIDLALDPVNGVLVASVNNYEGIGEVWVLDPNAEVRSRDAVIGERRWQDTGFAPESGNVTAVATDGANQKIYAGTGYGSVYVLEPDEPWVILGDNLVSNGVRCLAVDTARQVVYAGGYDSESIAAVFKYDGSTWTLFGNDFGEQAWNVSCLELDSRNNILYAGVATFQTGEVNVFRRNIGVGTGWVGIGTLCGGLDIFDLAVDETNNILYAAAWDGHVYKNCDASAGSTWIDMGQVSETVRNSGSGAAGNDNEGRAVVSVSAPVYSLQYDTGCNTLYGGCGDGIVYYAGIPAVTGITPPTGAQGQTLDVEISAVNTDFTTSSRAVFSGDGVTVNSTTRLSATKVKANITINPDTYTGGRNVWVKTGGDKTNMLVDGFFVTNPTTWYLAEGTNAWGFNTYITIQNPNNEQLTARLIYMNPDPESGAGVIGTQDVTLPPLSQTTVSSMEKIGNVDFSTMVECLQGRMIAVDRTMFWTGPDTGERGYHSSIGTTTPSETWYLPEGSSGYGFETWTLIQNPNDSDAKVKLTYMIEGVPPQSFDRTVPAHCRATWSMSTDIGTADASLKVTSDKPVIAERSMYRGNRREGSCSIGATEPAADYFLAEGAVGYGPGFTTWVLVQNPNGSANEVTLTYQTGAGPVQGPTFTMEPNSRKTVRLNDTLPANTDVSTLVHGSKPLVAERAMYWNNGLGEAFHASIGLAGPHMSFMLPDGQNDANGQTWTLVANPNLGAVTVKVTYMPQGGGAAKQFTDEIPPNSRRSYSMADKLSGRASILVESLDGARPIIVERAMYGTDWGSGTDTIGGYSD